MTIADGWKLHCATITCLPYATFTASSILQCQTSCLRQTQCEAISFHHSTSYCQLFNSDINQNSSLEATADTVTMMVIPGTRIPPELMTTSSPSPSSSSPISISSSSSTSTSTSTSTSPSSSTSSSTSTSTSTSTSPSSSTSSSTSTSTSSSTSSSTSTSTSSSTSSSTSTSTSTSSSTSTAALIAGM
ncbi:unnamed protein product [Adineta ricciae]|uniref:Apple domain-containing protein n=2 Tax=Adineta ricciae TaxID=249248 RepID=A0A815U5E9_ADIRI|nr:unnamed protein product [Adineta ricciae]